MIEKIIKKGAANWVDGIQAKGGHLILTNKSVYFEGHKFNIGKRQNEVSLKNIKYVSSKFLNRLIIVTTNDVQYEYRVYGKKEWENQIKKAVLGN